MSKYLTIGADPEFFLETTKKGTIVPSQGRIPGTKSEPYNLGNGYAVLRDNVAAEYNIYPSKSRADFEERILLGKQMAMNAIPYHKRRNIRISTRSSAMIDSKYLDNEEALNFGCEPDFNAWSVSENIIDKESIDPRLRCVGGHVHVGYIYKFPELNPLSLVRYMDLFLGVPSVFFDKDTDRRKLYGNAGAYRPTAYGIEYRTLSNFWIHDLKYVRFVWDATRLAVSSAACQYVIQPDSELGYNIQQAINKSDPGLAAEVLESVGVTVVEEGEVITLESALEGSYG